MISHSREILNSGLAESPAPHFGVGAGVRKQGGVHASVDDGNWEHGRRHEKGKEFDQQGGFSGIAGLRRRSLALAWLLMSPPSHVRPAGPLVYA